MNSEYWTVPIQREADPLHHEGVSNAKYMGENIHHVILANSIFKIESFKYNLDLSLDTPKMAISWI